MKLLALFTLSLCSLSLSPPAHAQASSSSSSSSSSSPACTIAKPRVFILTDISNEPDDAQSLVRLLLHSNELAVEGLVATTSYWLNASTHADQILDILDGYAAVVDNLQAHADNSYPAPAHLRSVVRAGHPLYGLASLTQPELSPGAALLVAAVDASPAPLYVQAWGGAAILAEALQHVQRTRSTADLDNFIARLRVYAISDQDDAGPWVRRAFPALAYVASIHGFNHYGRAAWTGVSGETYYGFDAGGPATELVSAAWIRANIQQGPLGGKYPDVMFIMEGDTPALLAALPNGLNAPEHPEWGGWGGRYTLTDWTGAGGRHFADAVDWVIGEDGHLHRSSQASIWRWRRAYQHEMAARMRWTLGAGRGDASHPPVVVVNGSCGSEALVLRVAPGDEVVLDAAESRGADGEPLGLRWWHYREISATQTNVEKEVPELEVVFAAEDGEGRVGRVRIPTVEVACRAPPTVHRSTELRTACQSYHLILEVTGGGAFPMTRYKRMILDVVNKAGPVGTGSHDEL